MHRSYCAPMHLITVTARVYVRLWVTDREYPVLFMSKSFHGAELNWKTQDKECGAIYKALEKFQYLLYNRHFILETDSKNLTFLNTATSFIAGVQMEVGNPMICFQH